MTRDPDEIAQLYAAFDADSGPRLTDIYRDRDLFRTWLNGFLFGLAAAAVLVVAIWIVW